MKFIIAAIVALLLFGDGPLAALGVRVLGTIAFIMLVCKLPGIIGRAISPPQNL